MFVKACLLTRYSNSCYTMINDSWVSINTSNIAIIHSDFVKVVGEKKLFFKITLLKGDDPSYDYYVDEDTYHKLIW